MKLLGIALAATVMLTACAEAQLADGRIRIAVMRDGKIEVNGKPTGDVSALLRQAPDGTAVIYYREDGQSEPTEAQMAAFILVVETAQAKRMPIQLSATPNFSTVVDDQGRVAPQ